MHPRISSALLLLAFLLTATALVAQSTDTGSVRGTVVTSGGAAIPDAAITLENVATGARRTTTSDAGGNYTFGALPVSGTYQIRVAKPGLAEAVNGPFRLRAGETATFRTALNAEAVQETVTVLGTSEHVRSDSPELGTRLEESALREIPVFGRKLTSLPLLNAAVRTARGTGDLFLNNTLFVINGGGRRQASFSIDGSTADDMWGHQTIFTNVPMAAVREFAVLTNAFSAEYGRSEGGAINVVTQSGTNELHGDLLALYRPASLEADAPVTNIKAGDELKQGSALIGGPIVAGQTHFLFAAEYNNQARDSVITSPLAPGIFTGDFHQTLGIGRLDQELGSANHLRLRGNIDRFTDSNPQGVVGGTVLPSAGRTFRRSTTSLQLSETAAVSSVGFNEARAIWEKGSPITQFTPMTPSTQFVRPGVSTEGESRYADLFNHQWQLADTFSWTHGAHSVRAGGDYLHSRSGGNGQEFGSPFVLGQFTFKPGIPATTPTSSLTIDDVQRYTQGFGNVTYQVEDDLASLFVQDDWRPIDRLTVNLGLRYEHQKLTGGNDLGPRLGFAWTTGESGRTVLRGGYGIFFAPVQSNIDAQWELGGPTGFFNYSVAPRQPGFPTSLAPIASFPAGAPLPARDVTIRPGMASYYSQFFDVSKLRFYPSELKNPRTQLATLGVERQLAQHWFLSADLVDSHTDDILWNLDANAPEFYARTAPGQSRPATTADNSRPIVPVPNGYRRILVTTNFGEAKYRAAQLNLRRTFEDRYGVLASYTWSHSTNNIEDGAPGGDPNDVNAFNAEWADSLLNQTHRGVLTAWRRIPFGIVLGGVASAASGRPYNITTGADNNGDAATTDRPVVNGQVIGRNTGRGSSLYQLDAFVEKTFPAFSGAQLAVRAEAFNLTNHANIVGRNGVYGNDLSGIPLATLGTANGGIANVEPGRTWDFSLHVRY